METVPARTEQVIGEIPPYPGGHQGRGIVVCGGGSKYFPGAWVLVRMLRQVGCTLPIEFWYLGEQELSQEMGALLRPYNVRCVDALQVRKIYPVRRLYGWELKAYAILHSSFQEVMLLDADNVPVKDPTYLFDSEPYREHGAVFWPDIYRKPGENTFKDVIWDALGLPVPHELPEFESAQLLVHKERCWRPLQLAMWFNEHSDFFYRYVYGDKETFNLAWRKLGLPFGMPAMHIHHLLLGLCQNDFDGERVFQHRCAAKWGLTENVPVGGFWLESDCLIYLAELSTLWDGRVTPVPRLGFDALPASVLPVVQALTAREYQYRRVGFDERPMVFLKNGMIGKGSAYYERFWDVRADGAAGGCLFISSPERETCQLCLDPDGVWRGRWQHSGEMSVELTTL